MGVSGEYVTDRFRANYGDCDRWSQSFTMFVGNLPRDMDEEWMVQLFSAAGNVIDVFIPKKRSAKQNWKFGFVRFACKEEGLKSIHLWNAKVIRGHKIFVKFARFASQWSSRGVVQKAQESNQRMEAFKPKKFTYNQRMPRGNFVDRGNTNSNIGYGKPGDKFVVRGNTNRNGSGKPSIRVFEEGNEWLRRTVVGKLYPTRSLVFIQGHLQNLGYADVLVRPMGVMKGMEEDGSADVDTKVADSKGFVADSVLEVTKEGIADLESEKPSLSLVDVNVVQENIVEVVANSLGSVDVLRESKYSSSLGKVPSVLGSKMVCWEWVLPH
ncbi:hypothetical protein Vadar_016718 [Vaccinium darrowii]|uniref:Uncharacterized protein n=1 Tax=Vaccinium darrowii TaxID=229202 RepID=A0ACB7Y783_9ERIC|nr:hypothetical protein Vadar_016718 [Vaccinium darrowii]